MPPNKNTQCKTVATLSLPLSNSHWGLKEVLSETPHYDPEKPTQAASAIAKAIVSAATSQDKPAEELTVSEQFGRNLVLQVAKWADPRPCPCSIPRLIASIYKSATDGDGSEDWHGFISQIAASKKMTATKAKPRSLEFCDTFCQRYECQSAVSNAQGSAGASVAADTIIVPDSD